MPDPVWQRPWASLREGFANSTPDVGNQTCCARNKTGETALGRRREKDSTALPRNQIQQRKNCENDGIRDSHGHGHVAETFPTLRDCNANIFLSCMAISRPRKCQLSGNHSTFVNCALCENLRPKVGSQKRVVSFQTTPAPKWPCQRRPTRPAGNVNQTSN